MNISDFFITKSWWGKLLGAFFGYLSAGPSGALFGLLVGNFFDRGLSGHLNKPYLLYSLQEKELKEVFFAATFTLMGHIAKADGHVAVASIQAAEEIMNDLQLSSAQSKEAQAFFKEGKKATFQLKQSLEPLKRACTQKRAVLNLFINIQYRAAQAAGLSYKKIQILNQVLKFLGYAPIQEQRPFYEGFNPFGGSGPYNNTGGSYNNSSQQETRQRQYQTDDLGAAFALLQVSPKASKSEVKKAYRRLLSQNHPDKLIANKCSADSIKKANEKTQSIVKAYEVICSYKGW